MTAERESPLPANHSAIDCDVHPAVPNLKALLPHFDDYWRNSIAERGIPGFEANSYPPKVPLSVRQDWRSGAGSIATDVTQLASQVLDRLGAGTAILNCLYGAYLPYSEDMGVAVARAVNNYVAKEWLERDPRLRASIVVPTQNIEYAVDEVERMSADKRFVQIYLVSNQETPLGRRSWWPLFAAAEKHGLPIGIHPGSTYRQSMTSLGWPSYYIEDYVAYAQAFQSQLGSLICEGTFAKFPKLKVVLLESGVTWLPGFLWRLSKFWRGVRAEVPWVDRPPKEIVRDHVRLTIQPFDAPDAPEITEQMIDHLDSDDILLYASDFPHWQFDGDDALPRGLPESLKRKILVDNPLATYPRLREDAR
jgi:predicted TIM-barrel fold metal-dependent hydrolase